MYPFSKYKEKFKNLKKLLQLVFLQFKRYFISR